jgi:predicted nucleotide-binding protein
MSPPHRRQAAETTSPTLLPERGVELLRRQREKATALTAAPAIAAWTETTSDLLIRALGSGHRLIMMFHGAGIRYMNTRFNSPDESAEAFMRERLPFVDSAIEVLEMSAKESATASPVVSGPDPAPASAVFLVHGRDVALRETVARWLQNDLGEGCPIVILHEQPSGGRTLIEKFEHYGSTAAYAVVLLTADDVGGSRAEGETPDRVVARLHPRSRQNVVFELGFFVGRLGRHRVAVVYEDGVELPSDIEGIAYIPADANGGWKELLRTELRAAGLKKG